MASTKRHAYDAEFKLKAISHALEHGNRAASREFNINESMVRKWRQQQDVLRQVKKTKKSFRGNKARWPQLEDKLEQWVVEQRAASRRVTTVTIRMEATALASKLNISEFRGGPSWCFRFMKRRNLFTRKGTTVSRTTVSQQLPKYYQEKRSSAENTETEEADGESMDPALEAEASADVKDTKLACGSPPGHQEENKLVTAKEEDMDSRETENAETEAAVATSSTSVSPLDPSLSQSSSAGETFGNVLVLGGEPISTSESEKDGTEVKTGEEFELNEKNYAVKDKSLDHSLSEPDLREDTNTDKASDHKKEINIQDKMDKDSDTKETVVSQQQEESIGSNKLRLSTADDNLDEMMDIGTVDQMEQEAQMKEEECNSLDAESSCSPAVSNTVSLAGESNSDETDVKPAVLPPPTDVDQVEDVKVSLDLMHSSSSPSSEATASTGRDSSSPAAMMNGMKVVKLLTPRLETERLQEADQSVKSSPSPPLVKVKDEPIDEEYEQALISSTSTATVKDEPNIAKEDLRIGSVFSVTPPAEAQTLPIVSPSSVHMSCSHCKKSLIKGQTAFQRKGSPALFCSTSCLTTSLPLKGVTKICHNCQKVIFRPQDVILAPDVKGTMKEFCSQNCLTSFNYKKNAFSYRKTIAAKNKHEVILGGAVHKLCSDACFQRFRTVHNLSMAGCANCGSFCHIKPLMLKLEDSSKTVCNIECLAKYKEKTKISQPCTMCHTTRLMAEMVDNKNSDDSVNLFCSSSCVMAFMVQTVSASGARLNCDNCGKNTVPAYHLAMSDTTIRNFCTLPCVMAFQVMGFTTPTTQPQQDVSKGPPKLNCAQCNRSITFKPELIQIKDKMVFVCCLDCSHEFKKANYVTSLCEYCKIEKITRDAKRINNKDCYFCSDGCKLLFRHDLTKNWGKHCNSCIYCHSVSKKLVTAQYGSSTEEFCSEECRSKYTMLFCHVAKCDTCGRKGKLKQSLPMLGEVKHFCDLNCLLQFCSDKVATQGEMRNQFCCLRSAGTVEATPVIANVMSLACSPTGKSNVSDRPVQHSTKQNTHTKTIKPHPPPRPKILKNKALLCRPLVQNKGVSCKIQTADAEAQTDDAFPKLMVLPVPVPVYVPVPMNMYSQCTPRPVGLPLPLPVPMFLPVTMDSAERIVETIQEIKEKIPSDPFEAELILMAEMVAEQEKDEGEKEESSKEKVVGKETERQEAHAPDGMRNICFYSNSLDLHIHDSQRLSKAAEAASQKAASNKVVAVEVPKLKSQYGVDAWKRWIQWRQTQPNLEKPRFGSRPMELKEDVLRCTTAELSYGLCCFINEVKRPNREPYSPDSLFYLCLGIQQYLFENGRVENIFMDRFYNKFSTEFTNMLRAFKPSVTASGYIHSRVEEEYLWDCKQLGAYSPIVLLNTLLFFCCKYFGFTTVEQHRQLSFAHVMRCTKTNPNNTKTTFLRFYPPISINEAESAKKRKEEENKEEILEMTENTENPLRCPVRLYEFYLSKCSESVKQRTNLFYLHPERCCVPNSPLWFSSTPLDDSTMEAMLTRILTVRELHLRTPQEGGVGKKTTDDPSFIPDEEEDRDSE
uniref:HTH CENPB-type domain-containing protein n=1 Tax=Anabas testudineus TaxID=64144 RepID=A0A7N6B6A5_ANATE